jgi:hypothetical protein
LAGWLGDDESTPGWLRTTIARCRTATHASSQASSWASISVRAVRADDSGKAGTVPLAHGGRVLRTCCQATSAGIDVLCDPLMARSDAENSSETGAFTWTKQDRQGSGLVMLVSGMLRSWQPKCMHPWHASTCLSVLETCAGLWRTRRPPARYCTCTLGEEAFASMLPEGCCDATGGRQVTLIRNRTGDLISVCRPLGLRWAARSGAASDLVAVVGSLMGGKWAASRPRPTLLCVGLKRQTTGWKSATSKLDMSQNCTNTAALWCFWAIRNRGNRSGQSSRSSILAHPLSCPLYVHLF